MVHGRRQGASGESPRRAERSCPAGSMACESPSPPRCGTAARGGYRGAARVAGQLGPAHRRWRCARRGGRISRRLPGPVRSGDAEPEPRAPVGVDGRLTAACLGPRRVGGSHLRAAFPVDRPRGVPSGLLRLRCSARGAGGACPGPSSCSWPAGSSWSHCRWRQSSRCCRATGSVSGCTRSVGRDGSCRRR